GTDSAGLDDAHGFPALGAEALDFRAGSDAGVEDHTAVLPRLPDGPGRKDDVRFDAREPDVADARDALDDDRDGLARIAILHEHGRLRRFARPGRRLSTRRERRRAHERGENGYHHRAFSYT